MKSIETISLQCNGIGERIFPKGILVKDLLETLKKDIPEQTVLVNINNKLYDLNHSITKNGSIDFVHITSRDGFLCYQRSLSFVFVKALKHCYPNAQAHIKHSLNKGFYCEIEFDPAENIKMSHIDKIKKCMKKIIEEDIPFTRKTVSLDEAISIFKKIGRADKVRTLKYRQDNEVNIYSCGEDVNNFYGYLLPSTGFLKHFDIKFYPPGIIICFPELPHIHHLPEYVEQVKTFKIFKEYSNWLSILGVKTAADLNEIIDSGGISDFIKISEALHAKKQALIADDIKNKVIKPRIILISGPSSSGKTTFSKGLSIHLRVNGERPVVINLDEYFLNRDHTPKDEFGNYDFEAFEAIDHKLFQQHLIDLLNCKEITLPRFDFKTGSRLEGNKFKIDDDQIIIIEGIHGLNKKLTDSLPDIIKYKIYVSALTMLNLDYQNRISTSDTRLIRRLVRDSFFRGYSAVETIQRWKMVGEGERKHIFPYQERADAIFNSALVYELAMLKQYAMPMLLKIDSSMPENIEAKRLIKFLSYFREISPNEIPHTSIMREFIGGSSFKY